MILVRDVTDLRRRDRELVTKDATIREIHHRVKNNLQTVAALLRLQARRIDSESARSALEEAVRRVGTIAIVHETLSEAVEEQVDFDDVADRLGRMVTEVSAAGDRVRVRRDGRFGVLPSEVATALAMVLTEVLQNAVEHGYGPAASRSRGSEGSLRGQIVVTVRRLVGRLHMSVDDDGRGLPAGFDLDGSTNLGLSIVRTLVESELGGQLTVGAGPGGPGHPRGDRRPPGVTCAGPLGSGGADAGAGVAALQRAPLVLAQTAPDPVVLASLERPRETLLAHLAASAHLLGLLDLEDGRTGVADREEQFRVLVEAGGTVAPIHGWGIPLSYYVSTGQDQSQTCGRARASRCERVHERVD